MRGYISWEMVSFRILTAFWTSSLVTLGDDLLEARADAFDKKKACTKYLQI
jgi:hypothetical protein